MTELRNRLEDALLGHYTIGREIGRGGMAIVYLAHDLRLDRDVALKVLRPELAATLGPDRFLLEIKLAAGLSHPHILPLHDSGEADGCLYYVMPYVPGESLRDALEARGQLPLVEALEIAREIADALDYAHRNGVVHRDIKPENILLQDGHAEVSDFGIARAISKAGERQTGVGIAVGTPDYMSPEQAAGVRDIDGRSDLYSLGCVLFEMLTGRPPLAITPPEGPGAGALVPRDRLAELTALRPSVPAEVAGVVARLLAEGPGDRFATAAEAGEALSAPGDVWTPRSILSRRQKRRWGAGLVFAVLATGVLVWRTGSGAELDRSLYVIVPFAHRAGAAPTLLTGDQCELLLRGAIERWSGVRLVDEFHARDLRLRRGEDPLTLHDAFATARELHSGLMLWGEVDALGDSIVVRGMLYDVASERQLRHQEIHLDRQLSGLAQRFNDMADSLLLGVHSPDAASAAGGTKSLTAWQAYQAAYDALTRWDFPTAESGFRATLAVDPAYPQANLWLAQIGEWERTPAIAWRDVAAAAVARAQWLSPQDRLRARALVAIADGAFPQACDQYRTLVRRDSLDFWAWYGLAECHARDRVVVRDDASPSHWAFRGSYHTAVQAYATALQLNASSHRAFRGDEFAKLQSSLYTEDNSYRRGYTLTPDTMRFAAFPSLDHDTLAFVPYPLPEWVRRRPEALPPSQFAAVARNRDLLRRITTLWIRTYPNDPDALEAHALVLETMGQLTSAASEERSALAIIRRTRALAHSLQDGVRLAVTETRLLLKLQDFTRARSLADSLVTVFGDSAPPAVAGPLARLALLTGHVYQAARLLPRSEAEESLTSSEGVTLYAPPSILEGSLALLVYAAAGGPTDTLRALEGRIGKAVDHLVEPGRRTTLRQAALDFPTALAFPLLGAGPVHRDNTGGIPLLEWQWHLSRGDTAAARAGLTATITANHQRLPGEVEIDLAFQYAELSLLLGDSATALQVVAEPLDALQTSGTDILNWVSQTGGLVRAMALRAELAARAGDTRTAAHWASAVVTLWSDADPPLQPIVQHMRAIGGTARDP